MVWSAVMQVFSTVLELIRIGRLTDRKKDLEILVLRKHLAIVKPSWTSRCVVVGRAFDAGREQCEVESSHRTAHSSSYAT
jgi:hypothetical protein